MHDKLIKSIETLWWKNSFYSEILTKCKFKEDEKIPTAGVYIGKNSFHFIYSKKFLDTLNDSQINYVSIHEVMHLLSNHQGRAISFKLHKKKANIAADMIINTLIDRMSGYGKYLEHPMESIYFVPEEYDGPLILESLYKWLEDNNHEDFQNVDEMDKFFDEHFDNEVDYEEAKDIIDKIIESSKQRGLISADIQEVIGVIRAPIDNPLKRLKGDISKEIAHMKSRTWVKPSLINVGKGFNRKSIDITVILDTSGSMEGTFEEVLGYVFLKEVSINLIQIDSSIKEVKKLRSYKELNSLTIKGLGGTMLQPAVDLAREKFSNRSLVILTDGYTDTLDLSGFKKQVFILTNGVEVNVSSGNAKQYVLRR